MVNEDELLAACNRFGLDNPCPSITKRLAWFGNQEDIEKAIEKAATRLGTDVIDP